MLIDDFLVGTKKYSKKFIELCRPINEYLGTTHIRYGEMDADGRLFCISTYPKWIDHFLTEQYYKADAYFVHPKSMNNGFYFSFASKDKDFKNIVLYNITTKFNMHHSFIYVEKIPTGGCFMFVFATLEDNYAIYDRLMKEYAIIRKMIKKLHQQVSLLARNELKEEKMDFAKLRGDTFFSTNSVTFVDEKDKQKKIQQLKKTGILKGDDSFLTNFSLSPQEISCLRSYMVNSNTQEVAQELNLAYTTISSYIENIKRKFNCHNKNVLLEKAELLEAFGVI